MNKILVGVVGAALVVGGAWYFWAGSGEAAPAGAGGGAGGGRGRGGLAMTVDTAAASRAEMIDYITVVGNLIGQSTVDVVPRVGGRIESINVRLGDRVSRGQTVVKIEDQAIREPVYPFRANLAVSQTTTAACENAATITRYRLERAATTT